MPAASVVITVHDRGTQKGQMSIVQMYVLPAMINICQVVNWWYVYVSGFNDTVGIYDNDTIIIGPVVPDKRRQSILI